MDDFVDGPAAGYPIEDAGSGQDHLVLSLAARHSLTAYNASYLAVAIDRGLPLCTGDMRLASAAKAERVNLLGPLGGL